MGPVGENLGAFGAEAGKLPQEPRPPAHVQPVRALLETVQFGLSAPTLGWTRPFPASPPKQPTALLRLYSTCLCFPLFYF